MREYLKHLTESHEKGLALVQVPTGVGKSYEIAHLIKELADDPEEYRKIIYLTTLKKNLLDKDLEAMYGDDHEHFQSRILRIRANRDEVVDKLLTLEVPDSFQTDTYRELCKQVKNYKSALKRKIKDKTYLADMEENLHEIEASFRHELTKRLRNDFRRKTDRLRAVHGDDEYRWIGELYPAVFTDEHQVLVMSISKFLKYNSTIVEKSYKFLEADFLDNAIVFIDEFDSTKRAILSDIINRALGMKNDYISLFRQIKRTFVMEEMSRDMREAAASVDTTINAEVVLDECKDIWNEYQLGLSYKVADSSADRSQNFLIKDGSFHSILQAGAKYIRVANDLAENRVLIHFENESEFHANRKEDDLVIYTMLREISFFLYHFRIFLRLWGNNYAEIINTHRREQSLPGDEMSIENACVSILTKLDLTPQQQQIIIGEQVGPLVSRNRQDLIPDISFYQKGMEIFSFKDHDDHNDYTELEFVQILDTPEKILAYIADKALVIGASATAELESVVANYDLKYLKNDALIDRCYTMDKEAEGRIARELEKTWKAYSDGRITIHTEIVNRVNGSFDLEDTCLSIFKNPEYGSLAANHIRSKGVNEYYQARYCNIMKTMYEFMKLPDTQSLLYLGMALPQRDSDEMSEELFHIFESLITEDLGLDDKGFIFVLRGDSFDEDKEVLLKRLSNGEKIYVMSSYQTIGAGQNLQYCFSDKSKYIELVPYKGDGDKRHFTKDFDALYLGDVTNKTVNTLGDKPISELELLEMLFQIEELYSSGELNYREMEVMMKCAFDARAGKRTSNKLNSTRSIQLIATGYVLQAVGRICRTYIKSSHINIWIDETLLDSLDERELGRRILSPEMKSILAKKSRLGRIYTPDENVILNIAEKVSSYGNWWIRQRLSHKWTMQSMYLWRELRNTVMRYPTAPEELRNTNEIIRKMYVTPGYPINKYLYSQYFDFSDVIIEFGMDEIVFKNSGRAKPRGESTEIVALKVTAEDAKLDAILKYPGMRAFFEEKGYAVDFEPNHYIMSPVLFHNIYKGALGEIAGSYILRNERGIELHDIDDPECFEFFDYELAPGVYVDFKNWKFTYAQTRQKALDDISEKLNTIGAKKVYVINIVGDDFVAPTTTIDGRIVEIPALIDSNGRIIRGALDCIAKEDYEV